MIRFPKRWTALLFLLALLGSLAFSSCKMLRGDPRRNCNHPEHGEYMKEKQMERFRKNGL